MFDKFISVLKFFASWYAEEYVKDFRDGNGRMYDAIVKTNTQINQIILTVSVASLTAVAALNKTVFDPYSVLSFLVIATFIAVILLSVVNLYISKITLNEMQRQLNKNLKSLSRLDKGLDIRHFGRTQNVLNALVFGGFCAGLVILLVLLGFYIFGVRL